MKHTVNALSVLALANLVAAADPCTTLTTAVPACASACINSAAAGVGCTDTADLACQCVPASSTAIQNAAFGCVIASCTADGELGSVLDAAGSICACEATRTPDATTTTAMPPVTTTEAPPAGGDPCVSLTSNVPVCASACITSAASGAGCTDAANVACQCIPASSTAIQNAAFGCVIASCTADGELGSVLDAASAICACEATQTTDVPVTTTTSEEPVTTTTSEEPVTTTTSEEPVTTDAPCSNGPDPCLPLSTKVPDCATDCIKSAASAVGCTDENDLSCQCIPASSSAIQQSAFGCVAAACDAGKLGDVLAGAASICACEATRPAPSCEATTTSPGSPDTTTTSEEPDTTTTSEPVTTNAPCSNGPDPCLPLSTAVPDCATSCIKSAASAVGCTDENDLSCQCIPASSSAIQGKALGCVQAACPPASLGAVLAGAGSICACEATRPAPSCEATTTNPGGPDTTSTTSGESGTTSEPITTEAPCSKGPDPCLPLSTKVPDCATDCIKSAASAVGCTDESDLSCQCIPASSSAIQQSAFGCVAAACDSGKLGDVLAGAASICACEATRPAPSCGTTTPGNPDTTTKGGEDTTTTADHPGTTSSCVAGEKPDCGPVASSAVPACAQPCFSQGAPKVGCDVNDYACQCQSDKQSSLSAILPACVATACPPASIAAVLDGASSVCACANAAPTGGSCPTQTGGNPPGGGTTTPPTPTGGHGSETTCAPGTKDCAGVASASIPACAQPCFTQGAPKVGCDVTDFECQCQADKQSSLSAILPACVATACPPASIAAVLDGASAVCGCANAPAPTGCGSNPGGSNPGGSNPGGSNPGGNNPGGNGGDNGSNPGGNGGDNGSNPGGNGGDNGSNPGGNGGDNGSNPGGSGGNPPEGNQPGPGSTCEVVTLASCETVITTTSCYATGNPTGGSENPPAGGGGSEPTAPPTAAGSRKEIGIVAGVFGAAWLAAVAL